MTEQQIIRHLIQGLDNNRFPFQMANAFIYNWECDYWALDTSGFTREFEIKVSRSDYFVDKKKDKHNGLAGANYFYYVVPSGLITAAEVDPKYGLIYVDQYGCLKFVRRPKKLHGNKFDRWQQLAHKLFFRYKDLWREKQRAGEITVDDYFNGLLIDSFDETDSITNKQ